MKLLFIGGTGIISSACSELAVQRDQTDQFVFVSSASAYQKPVNHYLLTEETPQENPFWEYSRGKIACENLLRKES